MILLCVAIKFLHRLCLSGNTVSFRGTIMKMFAIAADVTLKLPSPS